ncbi:MAG: TIGR00341 family protein [Planctomycetota bacterium]
MLDVLERQFTGTEGFRVILLPVEATIPRPPEPEPEPEPPPRSRVGREELLDDLASGTRITTVYLALVVLSTIVAAVGLMRDNVAVVIGAMVIAPLLTPNVALALATALGDFELMRKALKTNLIGIATALVFAVVVGAVLPRVDSAGIASRTETGFADIILALAAGAAGALVFTTGVPATLVGVMVAVALLPPLVTAGLRLAAGDGRAPAARSCSSSPTSSASTSPRW